MYKLLDKLIKLSESQLRLHGKKCTGSDDISPNFSLLSAQGKETKAVFDPMIPFNHKFTNNL